MGSGASKKYQVSAGEQETTGDDVWKHHDVYSMYNLKIVESMLDGCERTGMKLGKAQFFSAFMSFEVMQDDGSFLQLPIEEFERVSNGEPKVNAREFFMILGLLCDGRFEDRMGFLFRLFDANQSGSINVEEMAPSVALLLDCLLLTKQIAKPTDEQYEAMVNHFKKKSEENGDPKVSKEQFLEWCAQERGNAGAIAELSKEQRDKEKAKRRKRKPRKKVRLNAAYSKKVHEHALKRFGNEANKKRQQADVEATTDQLNKEKEFDKRGRRYRAKQIYREKNGRVAAVASKKVMADLFKNTDLNYQILSSLRQEFTSATDGKDMTEVRYCSRKRFKELMIAKFPKLESGRVLDRICDIYDANDDEKIYYDEFVRGLVKFCGGVDDQIDFLLMMFDTAEDGILEVWEIADSLEDASDDFIEVGDFLQQHTQALDKDGSGDVDRDEFIEVLKNESMYLNFCWLSMPTVPTDVSELLSQLRARMGLSPTEKCDIAKLITLAKALPRSNLHSSGESGFKFDLIWVMVRDSLELTEEDEPLCRDIFSKLEDALALATKDVDQERRDSLELELEGAEIFAKQHDVYDAAKYWAVLAKALLKAQAVQAAGASAGTLITTDESMGGGSAVSAIPHINDSDKASILYALISWDLEEDSTILSADVVRRFLSNTKQMIDQNGCYIENTLALMDVDSNGVVTLEELKASVMSNPDTYLMLLGV
jgi:Ca2+-binding EF-hand superfamily protein